MSTIDQVIARSRQPGGFKERKRFTVARQRAIRKMRQFALADPHYYVLELIQAAVANQATHVDLRCETRTFAMSYIGGGFGQQELAQLFDFLFASKEDFEHGDIRQLALGVNALMIMEPSRITIESGDGTLGGTTRIEINTSENTVDVGTPEEALRGTFVRAEDLRRSKLRGKSNLEPTDYGPAECAAIETRCLSAPVPIFVNDHPVFGYSSVRTPQIFGYDNVVTFDEGDLYGSIGIARQTYKEAFKVLTWGTWIQSIEHDLMSSAGSRGRKLGGVVAYDRLNKTADHSGIVRDERLAQMWARLKPYAFKSLGGQSGKAVFQIARLGGGFLEPRALREMLQEHGTAVVVPPMLSADGPLGQRAWDIGRVLDAPVLAVDPKEMPTLRNLGGSKVRLLRPDLENPDELAFFKKKTAHKPARPWIIAPVELSPLGVADFVELLVAEEIVSSAPESAAKLRERLGESGELTGTVFTPVDDPGTEPRQERELWVRVRTVDRVVWQGAVTSAYPGHVLDIDVPAVSPSALLRPVRRGLGASLARLVAEVMARHAVLDLERCAQRALESLAQLDIEPGSTGARVALAALARGAVKRLRSTGAGPEVRFSLVDAQSNLDLLDVPVFRTLEGRALSMHDLSAVMAHTHGLVYGVVPEVEPDLDGLDRDRILALDLETERLLMQIVGAGAYVRVDKRDVLTESDDARFQVRDIALGLRSYGEGALLVESTSDAPIEEETIAELVERLVRLVRGGNQGPRPRDKDAAEELRRQAVRHLQWFVCRRRLATPTDDGALEPTYGVEKFGLFLDAEGRAVSLEEIEHGFRHHGRMVMIDGRSRDVCDLGVLDDGARPEGPPRALMMNAWVLGLLQPFGEVAGAFDFDLSDAEAASVASTPETAFVASVAVEGEQLRGRIGLPEAPVADPAIAVVSAESRRVYELRQPAIDYGVVGLIEVASGDVESHWQEVSSAAVHAGIETLRSLIDRLADLQQSDDYERVLSTLFGFASKHLHLASRPDQTIVVEVDDPLAQQILDLPVFATGRGVPISAQRLIHEFCLVQARGRELDETSRVQLADDVPRVLLDWVSNTLRPENVAYPAAAPAQIPAAEPMAAEAGELLDTPQLTPHQLACAVETWIRRLRPDDHAQHLTRSYAEASGHPEEWVRGPFDHAQHLARSNAEASGHPEEWVRGPFDLQVWAVDMSDERAVRDLPSQAVRHLVEEMQDDEPFCYTTGRPPVLVINLEHWLVRQAMQNGRCDPQAFAWLLLGAYAHINALLEPVTNDHELDFHLRVAQAIERGELSAALAETPER